MRNRHFVPYRERIVSQAEGRVLEIGIGAGANLPFYPRRAGEIIGLEPAPRLAAMARRRSHGCAGPVSFIAASAEAVPLVDASIDSVVMTWTLCSVPDAARALGEIRRVLRPRGRLLFVEHGLAPDDRTRMWQHRLTPVWKRIAGGCHLNIAIDSLIKEAGFRLDELDTGYMPGPKLMAFIYEGCALPS